MSRRPYILLLFLVAIVSLPGIVTAQETTGAIEGYVKDSTGAVVPNVTVNITNAANTAGVINTGTGSGFRRNVNTDSQGFFRALQVPPGQYDVVAAATGGFGEARYQNIV